MSYTKQNQIILYDILSHQAQRILQPGVRDVQWFPSGVELLFVANDSSAINQVTWSSSGRSIGYLSVCSQQEFATEMWVVNVNHPVPIRQLNRSSLMSLQWSPLPITETPLNTFTSQQYRVRFSYPSNWQKVNEERYEGEDGFFQITALSSNENLDTVCRNEAFHPLLPYGSSPQISALFNPKSASLFNFPIC